MEWVREHLADLTLEGRGGIGPGAVPGGQTAADAALAGLDIDWYAKRRSTVLPVSSRGATRLSPYIRHGLLSLRQVWDRVASAPAPDRRRFRDELLWQEYARHLYARVGVSSGTALRREQPAPVGRWDAEPWPTQMRCVEHTVSELRGDGWLVNQSRMWLASQWTVRAGADWRAGEDEFFSHLLDGSRAANRLGWQWTVGTASTKPYGFSRWQVRKRAPKLCQECPLSSACPIEDWPDTQSGEVIAGPHLGPGPTAAGPAEPPARSATAVWLTAESLGATDPALASDPSRPAVFVFDEPLLRRLRLSGKRLVFLAETLGELAATRDLEIRRGPVVDELNNRSLATTYAPVPGWQARAARLRPAEVHPWPWLARPNGESLQSYSAWRKRLRTPS